MSRGGASGLALRVLPPLLGLLALLALPARASAYPQFAFKGYGSCGDCHHSPTGGGLANSWGRSSLDVSSGFGTSDWAEQDLTYDPAAPLALKLAKRSIDQGIERDPAGARQVEIAAIEEQLASGQWMGKP